MFQHPLKLAITIALSTGSIEYEIYSPNLLKALIWHFTSIQRLEFGLYFL